MRWWWILALLQLSCDKPARRPTRQACQEAFLRVGAAQLTSSGVPAESVRAIVAAAAQGMRGQAADPALLAPFERYVDKCVRALTAAQVACLIERGDPRACR